MTALMQDSKAGRPWQHGERLYVAVKLYARGTKGNLAGSGRFGSDGGRPGSMGRPSSVGLFARQAMQNLVRTLDEAFLGRLVAVSQRMLVITHRQ